MLLLCPGGPWGTRAHLICTHLGTGLLHLVCPKHPGQRLFFLPLLAFQHLEKATGGARELQV